MNIQLPHSHLFRTTQQLQEACLEKIGAMVFGTGPSLDEDELAAAKAFANTTLKVLAMIFEGQGIHFGLRANLDDMIQSINDCAD
ncbi:hypothetical protein [Lysobacter antibioticus]|uniref:hypothetical protein n=1 Tax=Lysobacter antibioticus TaxID=84531 RepID=UPI0004D015F0|nr:hypothetical protein [Lysobacter antibioticus]